MSSIAIIQQQDAVHLITDAAHYTPAGIVVEIASKITELPESGCVFSTRGSGYATETLEWLLCRFTSFDAIMTVLPGILSAVDTYFLTLTSDDPPAIHRHFLITVAGWSDALQRMAVVTAATYEPDDRGDTEGWLSSIPGYQQYCAVHMPEMGAMPPIDTAATLGRTLPDLEAHIESIDPATDGLAMFEAQRLFASVLDDRAQYAVGGFAELTTIKRDGISRRILKEYPDRVGRPIVPEGAEPIEDVWARELESRATTDVFRSDDGLAVGIARRHPAN